MAKENKELLLVDLSARLPYKTVLDIDGEKVYLVKIDLKATTPLIVGEYYNSLGSLNTFAIEQVKPYLRHWSDMTEEERKTIEAVTENKCSQYWELILSSTVKDGYYYNCGFSLDSIINIVRLLNAYHIDYNGLIEKGLAIKVTKDNNPYERHD